jgi:two-component sensor histidine kinase
LEVERQDGNVKVTVADNGIGFSPDKLASQNSVGLQIVQALVDQLSGNLQWSNGQGTCATFTFPEDNA